MQDDKWQLAPDTQPWIGGNKEELRAMQKGELILVKETAAPSAPAGSIHADLWLALPELWICDKLWDSGF